MPPELAKNDKLEVRDRNGQLIPISLVSPTGGDSLWEHPGLMGGGNIQPYIDGTDYDIETAAALNTHAGKRRGYFGEYLFDMPQSVSLKIIDQTGAPLPNATVAFYQKNPGTENIDNIPEFTGTTNSDGLVLLPNRHAISVTTATGHSLHNNPFGQIRVTGENGTMFVKVKSGNQEGHGWLFVTDLNVAYWSGNQ